MRIHLADTSHNRGQYDIVTEEKHPNHLVSFAYKKLIEKPDCFPAVWNAVQSNVIIDSGAFTVYKSGGKIDRKEYLDWALNFKRQHIKKLNDLTFMTLDVINDGVATLNNLRFLEDNGLNPIPVFTYRDKWENLDSLLRDYPYIAFGGLFDKKNLKSWLDGCFSRVIKHRQQTGVMRKIHLLGVVLDWTCFRYPAFSCDSSTWVFDTLAFGGSDFYSGRLPKYTAGDPELHCNLYAIKRRVRKTKRLQDDTTNLWKSRGITFDD